MTNKNINIFDKCRYDSSKCLYAEFDNISLAITKKIVDAKNPEDMKVLFREFDFSYDNITFNNQIHSSDVRIVNSENVSEVCDADALITNLVNVPLVVFTADCVPIALIDNSKQVIAVIHAGWRGTYGNIVTKTIDMMKEEYGTEAEDLKAIVGPAICVDSYNVSEELIEKFRELLIYLDINDEYFYRKEKDIFYLDLNYINEKIMLKAGVKKENIYMSDICTFIDEDFFSYRRDKMTTKRIGTILEIRKK